MTRFLALAGVLCISFSAIFVRLADVSPTTAAFFRCAYAVPFLLLLWWIVRERDHRRRISRWLAFASGLILSLDLSFWHYSIMLIGAGLATVLGNTQVLFVGLAAWLLHRERPSNLALLVIPSIFVGVVLISGLGRVDAYGNDPIMGVFYGILTGISYAAFLLVFRGSNRELAPAAGPLLDATVGASIGCLVVGVLVEPSFSLAWTWPAHGWLLALALGSQVVGWLLIAIALPRLAALETSVILLLQPMLTVLWASLIFVERLSRIQWMGVALVLGGVGVLSTWGSVVRKKQ
jgi:drug/metabolite transporter (DMT)-like permease